MLTTSNERIRELEDEARRQRERAEELEADQRRASEERHDRLDQERRETRRRIQEAARQASDWPEAFNKQLSLYGEELFRAKGELQAAVNGLYPGDVAENVRREQTYVADLEATMEAIQIAREVYHAEMNRVRPMIEALQHAARAPVIDKLCTNQKLAGTNFIEHFRDDDPSEWLNW